MRAMTSRLLSIVLLAAGCASTPEPETKTDDTPPPQPACEDKGPAGTPDMFKNAGGVKIDAPKACEDGTYIRVYGAGKRRIAMAQEGKPRGCEQAPLPDAAETECPEIFADAFGRDVTARLANRGVKTTGLGLGACGSMQGTELDSWNFSISVADWAQADLAVTAVSEELSRWGAGHHFGVTIRGIPCAVPLGASPTTQ
jgi:hypothetical protein